MTAIAKWIRRCYFISPSVHAFLTAWQTYAKQNHVPGQPAFAPLSSFIDGAVRMTDAYRIWAATGKVPGEGE